LEDLIVADTDVIIDFFTDVHPFAQAVYKIIEKDKLAITSISVFELYAGISGKKRLEQIENFVKNVFIYSLNTIEAAIAGKIFTQLKAKGKLIGNQDILIAGICIANSLPLLTRNVAHFEIIKDIKLIAVNNLS